MNPMGECLTLNDLLTDATPVWFSKDGKVRSEWLSACEEERKQTKSLMERIIDPSNLQKACKQVVQNAGSGGVDKMEVGELQEWLTQNWKKLAEELINGEYKPSPVKGIEIPKPQGGTRLLGIPTVKDRLVQQAILEILTPMYDKTFSDNSYGFRPKRNAHQALSKACQNVKDGYTIIVDIDLAKFFDEVNHHRLMWMLGTRIGDTRVLRLIKSFLKTGILLEGMESQRIKGTPQGSPLSPLLSNIVLDELDQELQRRGHRFVRYADDLQIFVKTKESALRVQASITTFIESRMKLKVNHAKSAIRQCYDCNFLGHSLLKGGKLGLGKKSEQRLKDKIREVTKRNKGESFESIILKLQPILRGWLQYYKYANMSKKLRAIESWLRRKLRCYRLKQCKRVIGIVRFLRSLKVEKKLSWKTALSGKGWWRISNSPALNIGMNNTWFKNHGLYGLIENYKKLHSNPI